MFATEKGNYTHIHSKTAANCRSTSMGSAVLLMFPEYYLRVQCAILRHVIAYMALYAHHITSLIVRNKQYTHNEV